MTNRREFSGPLCSSKVVVPPSGPKMYSVRKRTLVFSPILTWGDFEQQFWVYFFPVNVEANAINALESTSYHQGDQTVDDYLDSFQTLVSNVGYMDPQTLVVKFRCGLRLGIQNQIATMPYGLLADTNPDV